MGLNISFTHEHLYIEQNEGKRILAHLLMSTQSVLTSGDHISTTATRIFMSHGDLFS